MPLRIEDHGLIGDCGTAPLVGKDSSVDWYFDPRPSRNDLGLLKRNAIPPRTGGRAIFRKRSLSSP
jgi:hypothetical protein